MCRGRHGFRVVAAQVGIETKVSNQLTISQYQAISPRRFQRGFDRVNLHRPTGSSGCGGRTKPAEEAGGRRLAGDIAAASGAPKADAKAPTFPPPPSGPSALDDLMGPSSET